MKNLIAGIVIGAIISSAQPAKALDMYLMNCIMHAAIINGLLARGESDTSAVEKAKDIFRAVRF